MHPAWSIIFFTSISGLGLGLAGLIVLGLLDLSLFSHLLIASSAVFGLIGAGLLSSTLHLGHPERAWRALSQWRSSWLSREGVLAVLVLASLACWFLFTLFFWTTTIMVWHSDTVNDRSNSLRNFYDLRIPEDCCLLASSIDARLLFDVLCMWWISCIPNDAGFI